MNLRERVILQGIPYTWITNLCDAELIDFYLRFSACIADKAEKYETVTTRIRIKLRIGAFEFRDGFCVWSASGLVHTVIYRSKLDWELWRARQEELDELRQEEAKQQAIEKQLLVAEDSYFRNETEAAVRRGEFALADCFIKSRAELRGGQFHFMALEWPYWEPIMIYATFPQSEYGISFVLQYCCSPQSFIRFAHWFAVRSGLTGESLAVETGRIYNVGRKQFSSDGRIAKAECLFWRRIGRFDEALNVCAEALKLNLSDGTKGGFAARLKRLTVERERSLNG